MKNLVCIICFAGVALLGAQTVAPKEPPAKTFATPEEARDALVQAAGKGLEAIHEIMGPGSTEILTTGDPVQDKVMVEQFKKRISEKVQLDPDEMNLNRYTLSVGAEEHPFAVPLMRQNGRWYWDVKEGKAEIRRRVIGGNELDAMEVCRGYVEAQEEYALKDWQGKGVLQYAAKIASSPGKKDGLYWPGDESPIAENVARAIAQGYPAPSEAGKGYHGYRYKILLAQGPDAPEGAQDYVVHGVMIGGFALVAWPAEYGVSGIMTFIVNQDGVVYEKDLGPRTAALASAMTTYNPDKTWKVSPDSTN